MIWKEINTPAELEEYINFEQSVFAPEDWSRFEDYDFWMEEKGLRIFLLNTDIGGLFNKVLVTVGSFNVFVDNDVAYMGGFAINKAYRGFKLSRSLMGKLIELYGDKKIVCKTKPKDQIMRKVLTRYEFKNTLDKFENKKIWSYWVREPSS